ncbi:PilZ domain-containing protein [Acidobacteria bacterium AB60]|nr:PilZ domain-containing protein [Acidobacteria bacterium AB60]
MERFEYRWPRFRINAPVRMTFWRSDISGRCVDISEEGMKVECPQIDSAHSRGTVTVIHPAWTVEIAVQIAYSTPIHTGLKFIYRSDHERSMVARFVASLGYAVCTMPRST